MPTYVYTCEDCGASWCAVRSVKDRARAGTCACGGRCPHDFMASLSKHPPAAAATFSRPMLSESCGVHPDQIDEQRRLFPHHEFTPDGRMIFRSMKHRNQCLKDLNMIDLS